MSDGFNCVEICIVHICPSSIDTCRAFGWFLMPVPCLVVLMDLLCIITITVTIYITTSTTTTTFSTARRTATTAYIITKTTSITPTIKYQLIAQQPYLITRIKKKLKKHSSTSATKPFICDVRESNFVPEGLLTDQFFMKPLWYTVIVCVFLSLKTKLAILDKVNPTCQWLLHRMVPNLAKKKTSLKKFFKDHNWFKKYGLRTGFFWYIFVPSNIISKQQYYIWWDSEN